MTQKDSQKFEAVIGLEIHAQIMSESKMFSGSPSHVFGQDPNSCVSFVDAAFPGMLPVLNKVCVHQAIKLGLGVGGSINKRSVMERKHYMYPDNPSGYQISQHRHPLVSGGQMIIKDDTGQNKTIRLNRIHIEQDAGKSLHDQNAYFSCIDMNRAGVGLMEIVSEPDLNTPDEVINYVKAFRCLMRHFKVCRGDMEKGNLRVDANISVRRPGEPLGTRVELKNMNSLRFLHAALHYEIARQIHCLENEQEIVQETRMFDVNTGQTVTMRTKEKATDYFYFPDPDLPDLVIAPETIENIKNNLPETPRQKQKRFMDEYAVSEYDAELLVEDIEVADFFENALGHITEKKSGKTLANLMIGEMFATLKKQEKSIAQCRILPEQMAKLADILYRKDLSNLLAKEVFAAMFETGHDPISIMQERNLVQISDTGSLTTWIQDAIAQNEDKVLEYLGGKDKLFGYFVGQVMKMSKGKANPQKIQDLLKKHLDEKRTSITP